MTVYREAGIVTSPFGDMELPEPTEAGPAKECPQCHETVRAGAFLMHGPDGSRVCEPGRRIRLRWWSFKRCRVGGVHLHQRCRSCGARWVRKMGTERFV